ncbi:hypothetical protein CDL15_Pgr016303 [Punica granatum]|uniref:Uncharacterized protein n=1 Tax=Punica granatum TaxID=22663 RepID=A0A218W6D9_PUNGR|nr:hypothetical protein CDL15_Pgr016303 [Punica granatum]
MLDGYNEASGSSSCKLKWGSSIKKEDKIALKPIKEKPTTKFQLNGKENGHASQFLDSDGRKATLLPLPPNQMDEEQLQIKHSIGEKREWLLASDGLKGHNNFGWKGAEDDGGLQLICSRERERKKEGMGMIKLLVREEKMMKDVELMAADVQRVDGSEVDGDGIAMNKKQSCKLSVATLFLRLQSKGREW